MGWRHLGAWALCAAAGAGALAADMTVRVVGPQSTGCEALADPAARLACHDRARPSGPCAPIADDFSRLSCFDGRPAVAMPAPMTDEPQVSDAAASMKRGAFDAARRHAEGVLARVQSQADSASAEELANLAMVFLSLQDLRLASDAADLAETMCASQGCGASTRLVLARLRADLFDSLGARARSAETLEAAFEILAGVDDPWRELYRAMLITSLARSKLMNGDLEGSRHAADESQAILADLLVRRPAAVEAIAAAQAILLTELGLAETLAGHYDEAAAKFDAAARAITVRGASTGGTEAAASGLAPGPELFIRFGRSSLYEAMGEPGRALAELDAVVAMLLGGSVDLGSSYAALVQATPLKLYLLLDQKERARELLDRTDAAWRLLIDALGSAGVVQVLAYLAEVRLKLGQTEEAARLLRRAAPEVEGNVWVPPLASASYWLTSGRLALQEGRHREALEHLHRALREYLHLRSDAGIVEAASSLGATQRALSQSGPAILYMKIAVNAAQRLRGSGRRIDVDLQLSLTRKLEPAYRQLAQMLIDADRVAEAEQVLLALKDVEYAEFLRRDGRAGAAMTVDLTPGESDVLQELNQLASDLSDVYRLLAEGARRSDPKSLTKRNQLEERRDRLQGQMLALLNGVQQRLRLQARSDSADRMQASLSEVASLVREVRQVSGEEDAVLVMLVTDDDATTAILTTPEGPVALRLPVSRRRLADLTRTLRLNIQARAPYRDEARALYDHLIVPVEGMLDRQGLKPQTLMLYLTDELRYLPFAALVAPDGRHLVQKYRLAVFTAAARARLLTPATAHWSVTAFGTTGPHADAPALPAVREELTAIVRESDDSPGLLPGHAYLDDRFNRDAWRQVINGRGVDEGPPSTVVHLATHFRARPGDWRSSYFLLGDGYPYRMDELWQSQSSARLDHLDLIALSACGTEFSDQSRGVEFEGLGALLQKMGAKAVIGTLWPIQDEGSARFMRAFYGARGENRQMSKAQALQQAQTDLLQGRVKSDNPRIDLRHPYYWAPFILMGNWL